MKNKKILVVEDDPDLQELLAYNLRRMIVDCEVVLVSDGSVALKLLTEQSFDFIITDLNIPSLSGDVLVKEAASTIKNCKTPAVIVSGNPNEILDLAKPGVSILAKPFKTKELFNLIQSEIERVESIQKRAA